MSKNPYPAPCATCDHNAFHSLVAGCVAEVNTPGPFVQWCDCTRYVSPRDRQADLQEGRQRAHDGAEAAASGHAMTYDPTDWRKRAQDRLDELLARGTDFTAEDVTDVVGVAPSPSAIGSLFLSLIHI